jgi:uncharacterized membrane protein YcgQ (UPF0703/DUF1980 family)
MVMTCCADDISFHGLVAVANDRQPFKNGEWITLTATLKKEKNALYKGAGPVFHLISAEKSDAPESPVATFN